MVEAVGVESVHKLGECPGCAHDAEQCQEHAPACQGSPQIKGWSVGHVGLATKDEEHVDSTCPGTNRPPVFFHPYSHNRMFKVLTIKILDNQASEQSI